MLEIVGWSPEEEVLILSGVASEPDLRGREDFSPATMRDGEEHLREQRAQGRGAQDSSR